MKKLISAAVLAACIFAVGLDGAQITNPSNPNYGTNKVGQCYVKTLNNWTGISNTTANLNGYPIQCDQYGNLVLPSGTFVPLSGGTMTGALTNSSGFVGPLTGNVTGNVTGTVNGNIATTAEYSNGTCTTAATITPVNGNRQHITLTNGDTCALTFTQPSSGTVSITLKVIQSATSTYNGTISGCKWPGGTTPTITATTGAIDFVSVYLDGSNAYCAALQNFH